MNRANDVDIRLGTRSSALARWQADWVASQLEAQGVRVEQVLITTGGDATSRPIHQVGGQGLFTKEIQRALLDERIDVAVHSLKDLPTENVDGLSLAAVPPRESPFDVLVAAEVDELAQLPASARVGTGSRRRRSQLLFQRPDLRMEEIRGNVDTRLRKLDEGQFDALVLAEAGLRRLELEHRMTQVLSPSVMLPAVGQGALGLETRAGDDATRRMLAALDDGATHAAVLAERAMLRALRGGCLAPVGAWGRVEDGQLTLDGVVLSLDGRRRLAATARGPLDAAQRLGGEVARQLLDDGAEALIAASRS